MIAVVVHKHIYRFTVKKFLNLKPGVRILFFFFFLLPVAQVAVAQSPYVDSMIRWVSTHPRDDSAKIRTLHKISYLLSETDTKESFAYYERVSRLSDSLHFTFGKSLAQINLGILLSSAGNYESSTKAFFNAIDLADSCAAPRLKAVALNNIGENFYSLKDFEKCRDYAMRAIRINDSVRAWRGVAINYELLHRCDFEKGMYADARLNLDKGMPFALLANENYIFSQVYLGYGKLHAIRNDKDSANLYFGKAIATARADHNLRNEYQVYLAKAKYLKYLTAHEKIVLLENALRLAGQTHFAEGMANAAQPLSLLYESLNRKDSSLFYYRMYRSVSDSLFSEHNRRNTIVNESEWMVKRKDLENNNLKQLAAVQKKQIAFKNFLLFSVGLGFLLALLVAFLIYKSIRSKKLKDESVYKHKIAETEMQALRAQMNPHFFFNSLNSIENFIMQNEKKLASDYLNKFARFIRSILDSSHDELIEMNKDIESLQLYIDLEQLRFNHKFSYCCQVDPLLLSGEYYVPSLLVQPFLENAINHGIGPSDRDDLKISLTVRLEQGRIHYLIEDNGIGRAQAGTYNQQNKPFHKSVGMKITQDRINIFNRDSGLSDSVEIVDLYDEQRRPAGTRIAFSIKLVSHAHAKSHIG
ncbi:MAG: histidine kinase [Bacteroidota bacterium]|nr:histidine kinase [Bacteroidota bacterium]MDP4249980.1 histidine kinase [Bacteroidota bacterium]